MSRIQILDPKCISKIAAGEVIERPASVVKELIENSIDASATKIRIAIVNGGKDLIEIKDDGKGISSEDLPLAIKRHSTSKINSEQDLESISTMGFRGEALYSIASISRFSISSRRREDELAKCVTVEGDVDKSQISEEVMATPGTLIRVRDLFFNFIVRRKFLKKSSVEHAQIYNVVAQYAVGHPKISFTLEANGEIEFQTVKSQNHLSAIRETYGKEIADSLLDVGITQHGSVLIHGYISNPGHNKRNRNYQHFYLNGRKIFSKILQSALEEGYGTYLMKQEFPVAFLYLELDPKYFDVNIHPQKREVLFYDEKDLMIAVSSTVSHCLKSQSIVPHLTQRTKLGKQKELEIKKTTISKVSLSHQDMKRGNIKHQGKLRSEIKPSELPASFETADNQLYRMSLEKSEMIDFFGEDLRFRGPLGEEFLLLEDLKTHDLILLDFHAAYERVNLEKYSTMFKANKVSSQTFLKPFKLFLTPEQRIQIVDSLSYLTNLGFDIRGSKGNKREIEVFAIPKILVKTDLKKFLLSLVDTLPKIAIEEQINEILCLVACHASYRAGEKISFQQTKELLKELTKTKNPTACAHGRPTYLRIPYRDFLKQIRRI